jgi:MFS family permease
MGNFNRGFLGEHLKGLPLQACIALCSAFSFTLFGYDQGVFGGLISTPILLKDLKISASDANLQGTVVAIYDIGCLLGCFICAFFGQKLGRRVFIVIGGALLIIGAGMQAGAHSYKLVIAGRLIGGIGTGLETTFVPIWVAECARASRRGALIAAQLTVVILGLDIAYWFDFGVTTSLHGSIQWRLPVAFQVVFVVLTWIMIPFLPESKLADHIKNDSLTRSHRPEISLCEWIQRRRRRSPLPYLQGPLDISNSR